MTWQLQLTNLSNWEGQDYVVSWDEDGEQRTKRVRPGESLSLYTDQPHHPQKGEALSITYEALPPLQVDEKPFRLNGQQVFPFLEVGFR